MVEERTSLGSFMKWPDLLGEIEQSRAGPRNDVKKILPNNSCISALIDYRLVTTREMDPWLEAQFNSPTEQALRMSATIVCLISNKSLTQTQKKVILNKTQPISFLYTTSVSISKLD